MITINLQPATEYRRREYGVLLESETHHVVVGRGVHNPQHPHRVDVWENRPSRARDAGPEPVTPEGEPTDERYSYLLSPQAVVISAHREERAPQGETLALGDVVQLAVHGYVIGEFQVQAKPFRNPHLVQVVTSDPEAYRLAALLGSEMEDPRDSVVFSEDDEGVKWFLNEEGNPYPYPAHLQAEHYPNDFHTAYNSEEEAEAARATLIATVDGEGVEDR